jgi:hypothetical protein
MPNPSRKQFSSRNGRRRSSATHEVRSVVLVIVEVRSLIPIVDVPFKLAPRRLILVMAWLCKTVELSITGFASCGLAIGDDFAMHEDGLWVRDMAGGFDGS